MAVSRQAGKPVLPPSTVYRPSSISRSAVCGLFCRPPSPFVYSFLHSLTVCSPPSTVCALHSFIRSPFVDGLLPPDRPESLCYHRPRSALSIRLFVPSFVDGLLPPDRLKSLSYRRPPSTIHRPFHRLPSAVPIRLFVPPFVDGHPPAVQSRRPPSAVRRPHSFIRSPIR